MQVVGGDVSLRTHSLGWYELWYSRVSFGVDGPGARKTLFMSRGGQWFSFFWILNVQDDIRDSSGCHEIGVVSE